MNDLEAPCASGGLVWQDIKVAVPVKRSLASRFSKSSPPTSASDGKILLEGLSGSVAPGEMLAIMGPSGAGKSTLLDVLSTRKPPSDGSVSLSIGSQDVKSISSYVEQSDSLLGVLTVRETIWYSAKLSLPPSTINAEIDERTDLIISDLGLSGVSGQKIGTPIQRGISGGQKRRVSIGCSLVTLPKILFLDEPTSGLDTFTAHEVIAAIRNLAKRHNIAVLATIHSPNWEIFSSFDNTLLLSKGRTIYQGSTSGVAPWFAQLGHKCPEHTNPADFMIELVNDDFLHSNRNAGINTEPKAEQFLIAKGDTKGFADTWAKHISSPMNSTTLRTSSSASSAQCTHVTKNAECATFESHYPTLNSSSSSSSSSSFSSNGVASQWSKTVTLTRRNFLNYSRNLLAYGVRLGMYLGMGVLLATVWVNLEQTDTRINDRLSVHFFSVAFLGFMAVAGIPAFLEERSVLLRESKNRLYGPLAFTLANTISTIPLMFVCSVVFSVLAYWSIGLHPGAGFFFRFLAFLYLGVLAAEFQALLIAAAIPIFVAALAVCAFLNGFWMCVQGYFIRAVNLPKFWYYWAHWIDYETYAFDILVKNDLKNLVFTCQRSTTQGNCNCSFPSSLIKQGVCAVSGQDVLDALQINRISIGLYASILVIIIAVYRVMFYAVLKYQLK
ncbi:related to ATP-binding cassette protein (ABC) transporter [Melanopsichium pennsylvanicum]|uniref:Related to ATP-binding cassette protein (ABC) transporter n=2 Tax=Melanopsichium pennsylvanicum TaxID=63383 RepID=A0AAJ5C5Z8_9BASI|nr:related to ATP-binding cassette protein (ABC) transporter [Melanopsichium pennsylvanicum 4]SNX85063.1 related to ATP-binding cassette protein (ABC) transporter [Melanopsichium pennsylvanicum]